MPKMQIQWSFNLLTWSAFLQFPTLYNLSWIHPIEECVHCFMSGTLYLEVE